MERGDRIITIKERGSARFVHIKDITHITCSGSLCTIYTANGKNINVCKLLKQFEEELAGNGFIRINRYALINFNRLENIRLEASRKLFLNETVEFTIARAKMCKIREIIR